MSKRTSLKMEGLLIYFTSTSQARVFILIEIINNTLWVNVLFIISVYTSVARVSTKDPGYEVAFTFLIFDKSVMKWG